jgi:hypothetical protein
VRRPPVRQQPTRRAQIGRKLRSCGDVAHGLMCIFSEQVPILRKHIREGCLGRRYKRLIKSTQLSSPPAFAAHFTPPSTASSSAPSLKMHFQTIATSFLFSLAVSASPLVKSFPEVIPGEGLPSLASLGLTSAQLYEAPVPQGMLSTPTSFWLLIS